MAVILWVMGLSLLLQGCLCSLGQNDSGCMKWKQDVNPEHVCCVSCHPGNRLVRECGPNPRDLCTPCKPGTFTVNPRDYRCYPCTQCVGAQVLAKVCTATMDTQCSCRDGLICGDINCSFCVKKCNKGEEPTNDRSCRPCPEGTFNDQTHQKCKPWKTKCPNSEETLIKGNATSDSMCKEQGLPRPIHTTTPPGATDQIWPLAICLIISLALMGFCIGILITAAKIVQSRKKILKRLKKAPIIRTATDEPTTLRAVECSFHEAQQEQGSSSESLDSKDSSDQLIA